MRSTVNKLIRGTGYSIAAGVVLAFAGNTYAGPLALPDSPLFLSPGVQPNLIMAIDDSGSMDFETLFAGNDGAAWWRTGNSGSCGALYNNSFTGCVANPTGTGDIESNGVLNFNNSGNATDNEWKKYAYLFPNGSYGSTNQARRRLTDGTNDHFAIPPLLDYAWARSPAFNKAYFNPATQYDPWVTGGGYTFSNSTPSAASFDPVFETSFTIDLTKDMAGQSGVDVTTACSSTMSASRANNFLFKVYTGMTIPAGTCMSAGSPTLAQKWQVVRTGGCVVGTNSGCLTKEDTTDRTYTLPTASLVAIRYFPATFYLPTDVALPANYGYKATAVIAGGKSPSGVALNGYQIKPANFDTTPQYQAAIQNFANWFTYYRKRHQSLRAGLGESFDDLAGLRVNGFTINAPNNTLSMPSIDDTTARTNLYQKFYHDFVGSGGTPNRTAVNAIISNFKRTGSDAPIIASCQKNFGMLFTDGFSNAPANGDGIRGVYGNVDGNQGAPYSDTVTDTLADAVMSAYNTPLRSASDFPLGKVQVPTGCTNNPTTGPLDCNRNLHMNFFAVTLGTRGLQFNPDSPVDPYQTAPTWPTTFPARHPSAVDDLWHATINGRGELLNARSPKDIAVQLKSVLRSIIDKTSSASAASVSSGTLSAGSQLFQAKFDSATWTGELFAYAINPTDGSLAGTPTWAGSRQIPVHSARNIFTKNSAGATVAFNWGSLQSDTTRRDQLASTPAQAERVLNYLRGDSSGEGPLATDFRRRTDAQGANKLGDLVASSPLFVGKPAFRYRDTVSPAGSPYRGFVEANANRRGVVYVGGNDGMLHAFAADTGTELFAYIPGAVFPRLQNLASQSYTHQFYVDGTPSVGDAFITRNGTAAWRTVLVGGLRKGGQGIYALDVTNPNAFGTDSVMWEFTDANDADLGYTFSQPVVVKLRNGRWAAVFGNGYNSKQASYVGDTRLSTTGNAVLYIVDLATGQLIKKIDTGVGYGQHPADANYDNGLSTPILVDTNNDYMYDVAYAGDLYGNMWKFDLSSASETNWNVAFSGQPLFIATDDTGNRQPITVRPEATRGPFENGVMVLFGTGKYLEPGDRLTTPQRPQAFYGIVDRGRRVETITASLARSAVLKRQTIDAEKPVPNSTNEIRITSNNKLGDRAGWYMDLVSPRNGYEAEKQVSNPIVRGDRIIFTTLIPDPNPCGSGGSSWFMELEAKDGSRLESISPFDLNRDGKIDDDDLGSVPAGGGQGDDDDDPNDDNATKVPPGGIRDPHAGIIEAPAVADINNGAPRQVKYLLGTSGTVDKLEEDPGKANIGRQSWRQIR